MLKQASKLICLQVLLNFLLFVACQDEEPSKISLEKSAKPKELSQSPLARLEWPQALHYFEQTYSALEDKQSSIPDINRQIELFRELESYWPKLMPYLRLKEAELYLSVGQWEKGSQLAQSLWDQDVHIAKAARYFIAQHAYQCRSLNESLASPLFDQQSETYLLAKLRLATHCDQKKQQALAEKNLVSVFPRYFSKTQIKRIFKSSSVSSILKLDRGDFLYLSITL